MQNTPGSDIDKHNCKASAGYTFSKIKNNCVKLFEEKIQLKEINPQKSYTSNATIILSKDEKKAELFIPSLKESIILNKIPNKKNIIYKKGKYILAKEKGAFIIKESNKIIFNG